METKITNLQCHIYLVLTYGSECWSNSKKLADRVQAKEIWFLSKLMRLSWVEHVSNAEALSIAGVEKGLLKTIRKRRYNFLGHMMRKEGLEHLVVTGKIEGTKGREDRVRVLSRA